MKKIYLLFLFLPLFIFSQTTLVKYYQSDFSPTVVGGNLSASKLIRSAGGTLDNVQWGSDNVFYSSGGWPSAQQASLSNYLEFSISPEQGYKIDMDSFDFNARMQGGSAPMMIRFSRDRNFSAYETIQPPTTLSSSYTSFKVKFPVGTVVHSGQTLYVRFYVYNTNNNFHLRHNLSGTDGPAISGTVSLENPVKPVANADVAGTIKNTPVTVDILANDQYIASGPLSAITVVKGPQNGSVKVNGVNTITYTPAGGYIGYDSFHYTLSNAAGVSESAKVDLQVVDGKEVILARWNNPNFTAEKMVPGITANPLSPFGVGLSITDYASSFNGPAYTLTDLPNTQQFNGNLDPGKYLQISVATDAERQVHLKSFTLSYRGGGTGNVTVKYSKRPDFSGQVFTLLDNESYTNVWRNRDLAFPVGSMLFPGETLYIRVYAYNTYDRFFIDFKQGASVGPALSGVVAPVYVGGCPSTVTWNGTAWQGGAPNRNTKVVIAGNYNTAVQPAFEACSLTVTNNAVLTVDTQTTVTVMNEIATTPGATLTVKNEANLIQLDDSAVNTGAVTVERKGHLKRLDYIYWASPVKGQELKKFSPGTLDNRFYTYNEANDLFEVIDPKTNIFGNGAAGFESAAKGYAIRASNLYPAGTASSPAPYQTFPGVFTGVPNNGVISFPLKYKSQTGTTTGNGYNLVGNPYPSNINFDQLVADNSSLVEGTAYFWTNLNPNPAMQGSNYPQGGVLNNYAILGLSGSIPATYGRSPDQAKYPSKIIEVGQGFIIKAKKAGNLVFKNSYRTSESDGIFFNKGGSEQKRTTVDRYWLELTTPMEVVTTALVAYIDQATDDYEEGYDSQVISVGSDALYTTVQEYKLGIQGRQSPLKNSDKVLLGTSHYQDGIHTLSISKKEGIFANGQDVFLKDLQTGMITNLSQGAYTFTATAGATTGRFELVYQPEAVLATEQTSREELVIYRTGSDFVVKAKSEKMTSLEVFDASGRMVYTVSPNHTAAIINGDTLTEGIYLLKIIQGTKVTSKKIIR